MATFQQGSASYRINNILEGVADSDAATVGQIAALARAGVDLQITDNGDDTFTFTWFEDGETTASSVTVASGSGGGNAAVINDGDGTASLPTNLTAAAVRAAIGADNNYEVYSGKRVAFQQAVVIDDQAPPNFESEVFDQVGSIKPSIRDVDAADVTENADGTFEFDLGSAIVASDFEVDSHIVIKGNGHPSNLIGLITGISASNISVEPIAYADDLAEQVVGETFDLQTADQIDYRAGWTNSTVYRMAELADVRRIRPEFGPAFNYNWLGTGDPTDAGEGILTATLVGLNPVDADGNDITAFLEHIEVGDRIQVTGTVGANTVTVERVVIRTIPPTGATTWHQFELTGTTVVGASAGSVAFGRMPATAIYDIDGTPVLAGGITEAEFRTAIGAVSTDDITPANLQQGGAETGEILIFDGTNWVPAAQQDIQLVHDEVDAIDVPATDIAPTRSGAYTILNAATAADLAVFQSGDIVTLAVDGDFRIVGEPGTVRAIGTRFSRDVHFDRAVTTVATNNNVTAINRPRGEPFSRLDDSDTAHISVVEGVARVEVVPPRVEDLQDYSDFNTGVADANLLAAITRPSPDGIVPPPTRFDFEGDGFVRIEFADLTDAAQVNAVEAIETLNVLHILAGTDETLLRVTRGPQAIGDDYQILTRIVGDDPTTGIVSTDVTAVSVAQHDGPTSGEVLTYTDGVGWHPSALPTNPGTDITVAVRRWIETVTADFELAAGTLWQSTTNVEGAGVWQWNGVLTTVPVADVANYRPGSDNTEATGWDPVGIIERITLPAITGNLENQFPPTTVVSVTGPDWRGEWTNVANVWTRMDSLLHAGRRVQYDTEGVEYVAGTFPVGVANHALDFGFGPDDTHSLTGGGVGQYITDFSVDTGDTLVVEFPQGFLYFNVAGDTTGGDIELSEPIAYQRYDGRQAAVPTTITGAAGEFPALINNARFAKLAAPYPVNAQFKFGIFLGTPGTRVTDDTVLQDVADPASAFTGLRRDVFTVGGVDWYFWPTLVLNDAGLIINTATENLGLLSNNEEPAALNAVTFNLIG